MKHIKKGLLCLVTVIFITSITVFCYTVKMVSLEHFWDDYDISAEEIFHYQYAEEGNLALFYSLPANSLIVADISVVDIPFLPSFLDPIGVRASYQCDIATGKWQKLQQLGQSIVNDPVSILDQQLNAYILDASFPYMQDGRTYFYTITIAVTENDIRLSGQKLLYHTPLGKQSVSCFLRTNLPNSIS